MSENGYEVEEICGGRWNWISAFEISVHSHIFFTLQMVHICDYHTFSYYSTS